MINYKLKREIEEEPKSSTGEPVSKEKKQINKDGTVKDNS